MLPLRFALGQECDQAFVGVAGGHQAVKVERLDLGQAVAHVALERGARGLERQRQRRGP